MIYKGVEEQRLEREPESEREAETEGENGQQEGGRQKGRPSRWEQGWRGEGKIRNRTGTQRQREEQMEKTWARRLV